MSSDIQIFFFMITSWIIILWLEVIIVLRHIYRFCHKTYLFLIFFYIRSWRSLEWKYTSLSTLLTPNMRISMSKLFRFWGSSSKLTFRVFSMKDGEWWTFLFFLLSVVTFLLLISSIESFSLHLIKRRLINIKGLRKSFYVYDDVLQ